MTKTIPIKLSGLTRNNLDRMDDEVARLQKQIREIEDQRHALLGRVVKLTCEKNWAFPGDPCGKTFPINKIDLVNIQKYMRGIGYEEPTWDCTEYRFVCPGCGYVNRMINRTQYHDRSLLRSYRSVQNQEER